jgi:WD40 repeat protein
LEIVTESAKKKAGNKNCYLHLMTRSNRCFFKDCCLLASCFLICICVTAQNPTLVLPVGHTSSINSVVFTGDGKQVVTASSDKTVKRWDVITGVLLADTTFEAPLTSFRFAPGERRTLARDDNGILYLFDKSVKHLVATLKNGTETLFDAAFSPDGKIIASTYGDNSVMLWNTANGKKIASVQVSKNPVYTLLFSPDSKTVLTISDDAAATLIDASNGAKLKEFTLEGHRPVCAAFSADGKQIACGFEKINYRGKKVTWKVVVSFMNIRGKVKMFGGGGGMSSLQFSRDNQSLLLGMPDPQLWDIDKEECSYTLHTGMRHINKVSFADNDKAVFVAGSDTVMKLYDKTTGVEKTLLRGAGGSITDVAFSPNSRWVVSASTDGTARIWDVKTGIAARVLKGHARDVLRLVSPDGKHLITEASYEVVDSIYDIHSVVTRFKVSSWSLTDNQRKQLRDHNSITTFYFSPDSKYFALLSYDHLQVQTTGDFDSLYAEDDNNGKYFYAAFSSDSRYLATLSWNSEVTVREVATGKIMSHFNRVAHDTTYARFFNGSQWIARRIDSNFIAYDSASGDRVSDLRKILQSTFKAPLSFSPKGNYIAAYSTDNTVRIWDYSSGKQVAKLSGFQGFAEWIRYSADGAKVMVYCKGHISTWDAFTGVKLSEIALEPDEVVQFDVAADGSHIFTLTRNTCYSLNLLSGERRVQFSGLFDEHTKVKYSSADSAIVLQTSKSISYVDASTGKTRYQVNSIAGELFEEVYWSGSRIFSRNGFTTSLYDIRKEKKIATLIPIDSADYLLHVPSGYYMGSRNAAKVVHYLTAEKRIVSFDQLDARYNRPDRVIEVTSTPDTALVNAYFKAYLKRISKLGIDTAAFTRFAPPVADFINRALIGAEQNTQALSLKVHASSENLAIASFNLWVNEVPVFGSKGLNISRRGLKRFDTTIKVQLSNGVNAIESGVRNTGGIESYRVPLYVHYLADHPSNERVHFIGVGIDQFADSSHNLSWSVKDIGDLAAKLKQRYPDIIIDTLFNSNVTRFNILALKQKLMMLDVDDKVIVSYSGHGMLSQDLDYYLSTYRIDFNDPASGGLAYEEFESLVDGIAPRKKLVLIDACHSGELDKQEIERIEVIGKELDKAGIKRDTVNRSNIKVKKRLGMSNSFELMQDLFANIGRGTGATIISAAGGMQFAQEREDLKNGVFTYSILDAFKHSQILTVEALKRFVSESVSRLTRGLQKPTSRSETNNFDWIIW